MLKPKHSRRPLLRKPRRYGEENVGNAKRDDLNRTIVDCSDNRDSKEKLKERKKEIKRGGERKHYTKDKER